MTDDDPAEIPIDGVLDLHAFRPRDVRTLVPDWLLACRDAGITEARVIHGKGTGELARGVLALLERLPIVRETRRDGNWGAVVVSLWPVASDLPRVRAILAAGPRLAALLDAVADVGPPGAWVAAGAVRNRVWHHLHGRAGEPDDTDVDVVWHGAGDADADARYTAALRARLDAPWEVVDQARMGAASAEAGVASFPETATAVAARRDGGELQVLAPHGLADLVALIVRPSPGADPAAFRARLAAKRWRQRFPSVRIDAV